MASEVNPIDIDLALAAFRVEHEAHVVVKVDPPGRTVPLAGLAMYFGALQCNWLEDTVLALQARVGDEQAVQGIVRVGGSRVLLTATSPEGVNTAAAGSLALSQAGRLYVKGSGSGNTGWRLVDPRYTGGGTALVAGDFALSSELGEDATVDVEPGSRDTAGQIVVNVAGAGAGVSAGTITLTFTDGIFGVRPHAVATFQGGTGSETQVWCTTTTTTLAMQLRAVGYDGETYRIGWVLG